MRRFSILSKLTLGFGTLIAMIAFMGAVNYCSISGISGHVDKADDASLIEQYTLEARIQTNKFIVTKDEKHIAQVHETINQALEQAKKTRGKLTQASDLDLMDAVVAQLQSFDSEFKSWVEMWSKQVEQRVSMVEQAGIMVDSAVMMREDQKAEVRQLLQAKEDVEAIRLKIDMSEGTALIVRRVLQARGDERDFIISGDEKFADRTLEAIDGIVKEANAAKAAFKLEANRKLADELIAAASAYREELEKYVELWRRQERSEEKMVSAAVALVEETESMRAVQKAEVKGASSMLMVLTYVFLLVSILLGMTIALVITRSITKPLGGMVARADEIAAGDLTATVPISSRDEIGDLAGSFNKMLGGLKTIVVRILDSSTSVSASSQQLSSASQQTNATVQQMAGTLQQIARGTQTQAQRIEETMKVMEQLHASIAQSAESSQMAAAASIQTSKAAQQGAGTVRETAATIDRIHEATAVTSKAVKKLDLRSEQMAEIVDVITNVADQTNLLALNAAIEAARAGDAGRGFAVVAEEVRKLAESSGRSATEIGKLIRESTRDTQEAAQGMDEVLGQVEQGRKVAADTGRSIEEIVQATQNISATMEQISAASAQMASAARQVVRSIEDVAATAEEASSSTQQASASTQQMVATMQEMASSAQSLARMGIELRDMVGKFDVGEEARPPGMQAGKPAATPMARRLADARRKMNAKPALPAAGAEKKEEGKKV
ncbi:MAG: methyl-accepting chemotaxis protein [Pseudomonadota bacterium]